MSNLMNGTIGTIPSVEWFVETKEFDTKYKIQLCEILDFMTAFRNAQAQDILLGIGYVEKNSFIPGLKEELVKVEVMFEELKRKKVDSSAPMVDLLTIVLYNFRCLIGREIYNGKPSYFEVVKAAERLLTLDDK